MQVADSSSGEQEERLDQLLKEKREFEEQVKDFEERLSDAEGTDLPQILPKCYFC